MRIDSLYVKKFRGIEDLRLESFQDVNLLLGGNDIGKTTVLESIMLFSNPEDYAWLLRTSRIRLMNRYASFLGRYSPLESFLHLFPFSESKEKTFTVEACIDQSWLRLSVSGELHRAFRVPERETSRTQLEEEREITIFDGTLYLNGNAQAIEIPEDIQSYRITRSKINPIEYIGPGDHLDGITNRSAFRSRFWEQQTIALLQMIDPDIEGIKLVPSENFSHAYNQVLEHHRYGDVPLYTFGDGMKKILSLASILPAVRNGILLIDEIETSLQLSVLSEVFRWLLGACWDYNIQLFVTTHSLEAISVLSECASEHSSELACYRLEKHHDQYRAHRFSENKLDEMVNGSGLDVR